MTANEIPPLLTADQLAAKLGVSTRKVYRWREQYGLPGIAIGRALYFVEASAVAWLESNQVGTPPAATNGAKSSTFETEKAPRSDASPTIATPRIVPRA